jgi:hypothetical protein
MVLAKQLTFSRSGGAGEVVKIHPSGCRCLRCRNLAGTVGTTGRHIYTLPLSHTDLKIAARLTHSRCTSLLELSTLAGSTTVIFSGGLFPFMTTSPRIILVPGTCGRQMDTTSPLLVVILAMNFGCAVVVKNGFTRSLFFRICFLRLRRTRCQVRRRTSEPNT